MGFGLCRRLRDVIHTTGSELRETVKRKGQPYFVLEGNVCALLAAKVQADKGQADAALATLAWVADNAGEEEYRIVARLRAAGLLMDKKQYDEALKQLDAAAEGKVREFDALIADRRGDVLAASVAGLAPLTVKIT